MSYEKEHISRLFDRLAPSYDRFNHLSSMGIDHIWRHQAVCAMRPADKVLDVAVGTADLAIAIVRGGKAKHVTGIDISTEMIRVGAEKVAHMGLSEQIDFVEGSAFELPYEDNTFDALTCAYGVRNFSQLNKGLSEFLRVLKPGGLLLILEFSYPQNRFIAWCYDLYFNYFMTFLGTLMTKDKKAFQYFYASVKGFIWGDQMKAKLEEHGFQDVTFRTQTCGISTMYIANK